MRKRILSQPRRSVVTHIQDSGDESGWRCRGEDEPTDYPPGTREKVERMRQRVEDGYELHSSGDAIDCTRSEQLDELGFLGLAKR